MAEYMKFWVAKFAVEILILLVVLSPALLIAVRFAIPAWLKRIRCKHADGVRETMSCDAICRSCGKNLGFIGSWLNAQKGGDGDGANE